MRVLKRKRDPVVPEMRARLLANRDGRLLVDQWVNLIVQPLMILALLLGAAFLVFGEFLLTFAVDFWWVGVPMIVLLVLGPVLIRAYRYARAPVHFARLRAGVQPWGWRKPQVFYTESDEPIEFRQRMAPRLPLRIDAEYLVYFLDEPQGKVLLSIAPAEHEDADHWLPTKGFITRHERRAGRG